MNFWDDCNSIILLRGPTLDKEIRTILAKDTVILKSLWRTHEQHIWSVADQSSQINCTCMCDSQRTCSSRKGHVNKMIGTTTWKNWRPVNVIWKEKEMRMSLIRENGCTYIGTKNDDNRSSSVDSCLNEKSPHLTPPHVQEILLKSLFRDFRRDSD